MAAQLYQIQGRYDLALAIYLQQQQPAVFEFIQEHHLLPVLHQRVAQLLSIDEQRAVQLLMDQYDEIPASTVVPSIQVRRALRALALLHLPAALHENQEVPSLWHGVSQQKTVAG